MGDVDDFEGVEFWDLGFGVPGPIVIRAQDLGFRMVGRGSGLEFWT